MFNFKTDVDDVKIGHNEMGTNNNLIDHNYCLSGKFMNTYIFKIHIRYLGSLFVKCHLFSVYRY